jgi:uncharacterized protein (DUF433 family)
LFAQYGAAVAGCLGDFRLEPVWGEWKGGELPHQQDSQKAGSKHGTNPALLNSCEEVARVNTFDRITFAQNIMGGRACIRGMRITVSLLVNLMANGMSTPEILKEYPDLEAEDIKQALAYAAALANDEFHPFAPTAA